LSAYIETIERPANPILRLLGDTTKFTGTRKHVKWVTCDEVMPAINAMQSFGKIAFTKLSKEERANRKIKTVEDMPLFVPLSTILSWQKYSLRKTNWSNPLFINQMDVITSGTARITQSDYNELMTLDPLRDWGEQGYSIGSVWPISSHQYRRSLAVYSAQSGLISLPALKQQFKQLTNEMAFYYRNNALEAKRLFNISPDHMAEHYEKHKPEADFLAFVKDIILSNETLKGSQGRLHELNRAKTQDDLIKVHKSRSETINEFKNGTRAYKETAVGSCESTKPCTEKLTGTLSSCFLCKTATLKQSKIQQTIKIQEHFLNTLPQNSPEYRAEEGELLVFKKMERSFSL